MRGKIISSGVIMADDGKKYFYVGEFPTNASVEFKAEDDRAVNVSVVQGESCLCAEPPFINNAFIFWDFRKIKESFSTMNIHSIKFFSFTALIISFLSGLAYGMKFDTGVFFWSFVSFLCVFWVVFSLCHLASNYALMRAFFLAIILSIVLSFLSIGTTFGAFFGGKWLAYVLGALSVVALIAFILSAVLYVRILAKITHEPFFLYSLYTAALVLVFFGISLLNFRGFFGVVLVALMGICGFVSFVFYLFALLRFREISIEQNATLKSEFVELFNPASWRLKKS
ncbi:hypothetical protein CHLV4088_06865 [Campylobacter helveticus]|uniref:hypothetical protein n=1 Tax=Campylobacter helveticus TaxID=28898 RepID=UPI002149E40A|nr:hypothetical protein [Campylobacter helveticus]MCR2057118.1 hypothetical protein [Campylobacter helveticus]